MVFEHVFMDWDDTIVLHSNNFRRAESSMATLVARACGSSYQSVLQRGREIDLEVAARLGLVREAFEVAWVMCYSEFCKETSTEPDEGVVRSLALTCDQVHTSPQQLAHGAETALAWLAQQGLEVTVWTQGDPFIQTEKIARSSVSRWIGNEVVVAEKNTGTLLAALEEKNPAQVIVVGNSERFDIAPALAVGALAVHVPAETWAHDAAVVDLQHPRYVRINNLAQLPQAILARSTLAPLYRRPGDER